MRKNGKKPSQNELGQLTQGIADRRKGTHTIFFFTHDKVLPERREDVTYGCICVD
jgi:hypothetical protein